MIGSKFKFFCYLESGTKPFKFEWFKNNQAILENKSPPSSSYTIKTNEDESMMSITAIDIDDEGIYSCSVRNDFGTDRKSIRLVVKGLEKYSKFIKSIDWFSPIINMWRL